MEDLGQQSKSFVAYYNDAPYDGSELDKTKGLGKDENELITEIG